MRSLFPKTQHLFCALFLVGTFAASVHAEESQVDNDCVTSGEGASCTSNSQCENNPYAKICVNESCAISCVNDESNPADPSSMPTLCSAGESCVEAEIPTGVTFYCQKSKFSMDLNLLDQCIRHFIDGTAPNLTTQNACALESNLNKLLDQNNDQYFNIFDLDLCVRGFLNAPGCTDEEDCISQGELYCNADDDCGIGLHCNTDLNKCTRECGMVSTREGNNVSSLDRECGGTLKVCDYSVGKCVEASLEGSTCQVNRDCPVGAYCFLGECSRKCYRSVDCPDASWYCNLTNQCRPIPSPEADEEGFDPMEHTVSFGMKSFKLDPIQNEAKIPMVIMNVQTKKQVFANPNAVFGYRLEMTYGRKQDTKCSRPTDEWSNDDIEDCLIDADEEFVTMLNPFGTIYGVGTPTLDLRLNDVAMENLTPGDYVATLRAIFNNGSQDVATFGFTKTTMSGDYSGKLSLYMDDQDSYLGNTNVSLHLQVDEEQVMAWNVLKEQNNLDVDGDDETAQLGFVDTTSGMLVTGYIEGNDTMVFNNPQAAHKGDNRIPVKGIYSADLNQLRLLAVIDMAADHCKSDADECGSSAEPDKELRAENFFGRKIRRVIQMIGPFDATSRVYRGLFRETISGLVPYDLTLEGGFIIEQKKSEKAPLDASDPLIPASNAQRVSFPDFAALNTAVGDEITNYCGDYTSEQANFANATAFEAYLKTVDGESSNNKIFTDMQRFDQTVTQALGALDGAQEGMLTINDFLQGSVFLCSEDSSENCIDEESVRCGLALHRKAILNNYVDTSVLGGEGGAEHELFCSPLTPVDDCDRSGDDFAGLVMLQEHNRFYKELAYAQSYQAGNDLSEAFFVMYRNQMNTLDTPFTFKEEKLFKAWSRYGQLRHQIFSPLSGSVAFNFPMGQFSQRGRNWVQQMHGINSDRIEALLEIIDLKRRIFMNSDEQDFVFIQHLMHGEYLAQVYLMALQRDWEGDQFAYAGQGPVMLEKGQMLLNRVNASKNPLGIYPGQVFFENSNLGLSNWENYRDQIGTEVSGGALTDAIAAVNNAVNEMQAALGGESNFTTSILNQRQQYENTIVSMCGPDAAQPSCQQPDTPEDVALELSCTGEGCLTEYECTDDACDSVAKAFATAVEGDDDATSCRLGSGEHEIPCVVGDCLDNGVEVRKCERGQLGGLLQEKAQLELNRKNVFRKMNALFRQIAGQSDMIAQTESGNQEMMSFLAENRTSMLTASLGILAAETIFSSIQYAAEGADCLVIVGFSVGTDCAGSIAGAVAKTAALTIKTAVVGGLQEVKSHLAYVKEIELTEASQQKELRNMRMTLDNLMTGVENYIAEYEMLVQQIYNLDMRIQDTQFQATEATRHYSEQVGNIVDTLIGGQSNQTLIA